VSTFTWWTPSILNLTVLIDGQLTVYSMRLVELGEVLRRSSINSLAFQAFRLCLAALIAAQRRMLDASLLLLWLKNPARRRRSHGS
jgi:hypothetical protein